MLIKFFLAIILTIIIVPTIGLVILYFNFIFDYAYDNYENWSKSFSHKADDILKKE